MNIAWRASALAMILSVFAIAGCSSTQPDRIETRTASLSFFTRALVNLYNCYNIGQDTNGDGVPDVDYGVFCQETTPPQRVDRPVPWRYSIKITVIRSGTTDEEVVTSTSGVIGSSVQVGDGVYDYISLTDYDPDEPTVPDRSDGDIYFTNGHQVSAGSPIYLAATGIDPGEPNILGLTPTFDFTLDTGDTVIVRVRKQPMSLAPAYLPSDPDPEIRLSAVLKVSGVDVAPQSTPPLPAGSTSPTTGNEDQAGITFSYTVR
jgi:hypothetical protein